MNIQYIQNQVGKVKSLAHKSRLRDAYAALRQVSEAMLDWETTRLINTQEESYRLMLDYAARGSVDPQRDSLHRQLVDWVLVTADRLLRKAAAHDAYSIYFITLRNEGARKGDTIAALIDRYRELTGGVSLFDMIASGESRQQASSKEREEVEKRIFDRVWVSFPLAKESAQAIRQALADNALPTKFKQLLISAITLGELTYHDNLRVDLLLDAYQYADNADMAATAIVGLALGLNAHHKRVLDKNLADRLAAMADHKQFHTDLQATFIELIRTCDTERITRKLRDEVVPELLKLRPEISKKLSGNSDTLNIGDLEANPEWAELLEQSGLEEKLRELSEIQEGGGDVMMGAFSQLKTFPFFNDVVNWLRPFDPSNSHFDSSPDTREIIDTLAISHGLCDSDKYSFALSLAQVPEQQKSMLATQLREQSEQIARAKMASLQTDSTPRREAIENYVRSLYRFYRLYRRKGDFVDPFMSDLNITRVPIIGEMINDVDTVRLAAEFFFHRGYWEQAMSLFRQLEGLGEATAEVFQKMGYCEQRLGNTKSALSLYRKAELIDSSNRWTMQRIAACCRLLGHTSQALDYYRRLETDAPDDTRIALNIGHCLLELGRDQEAIEYFYKVEYLDPEGHKHLRPLAWSLLRCREFDKAEDYYKRIVALGATADDYLNMGHLSLAKADFRSAHNYYRMFVELNGGDSEKFVKAFNDDADSLRLMGVEQGLLSLVVDQLLYSL